MKQSISLSCIILVTLLLLATMFSMGCAGDQFPYTLISSVAGDGSNGAIIAYEIDRSYGDQDICVKRIGVEGGTLWNNVVFTSKNNRSSITGMADDGKGNVIIIWTVLIPENGEEGLHHFDHATIARIDAQGQTLWQKDIYEEGVQAIEDDSGGAIVVWPNEEGYCAQRIGAEGNLLWEECLGESGHGLKLVGDEMGGALILRDNYENNYFIAQKLGPSGEVLWGQEGVRIKYLDTSFQQQPQIVSDGSGGAIITWAEALGEGEPSYVWVLRKGVGGEVLWKGPVHTLTSVVHPQTRVVGDDLGGAIIVWEDHRQEMAIYAQKVNSKGEALWQENGVPVCTELPAVSPRFEVVSSGVGGVVVAWIDGDRKLFAQMLDDSAKKIWGDKSILMASGVCNVPVKISNDNQHGFIIGWCKGIEEHHPKESYVQRIDPYGELSWGGGGIRLSP